MRSDRPKPLHEARGLTMLAWVLDALHGAALDTIVVVVGHEGDAVVRSVEQRYGPGRISFAEQLSQRGTGDAAAVGLAELDLIDGGYDESDHVLIVPGDTPLLSSNTVAALIAAHIGGADAACTLATTHMPDPTGYGRILRSAAGDVTAIVEQRDASSEQQAITEVNAGLYCLRRSLLAPALRMISSENAQNELYLTDVVAVLVEAGHAVAPFVADAEEVRGVNDRVQLAVVSEVLGRRISDSHMRAGVTIVQPSSTVIDATATIEPDVTVHPGTVIAGSTRIASGAVIGPNSHLVDAEIGAGARVESSVVKHVSVAAGDRVGPGAVMMSPAGVETG